VNSARIGEELSLPLNGRVSMKPIGLLGAVLALSLSGTAAAATTDATYIGNEGFLLESGGNAILIDALFQPEPPFLAPSPGLMKQMMDGDKPFHTVSLVLVTHGDEDHFDPQLAVDFLRKHRHAQFVAHQDVVDRMRAAPGFSDLGERIHPIPCGTEKRTSLTLGGIDLDILCLDHAHAAGEPPAITVLAYVADLGAGRVLHMGDAKIDQNLPALETYSFEEKRIAALFLPRTDLSAETQRFVGQRVKPASIAIMHVRPDERDTIPAKAHAAFPDSVIFDTALERRSFPAPEGRR
jgi:L-ascorbate metabolism protein UlaG (beta-lactamase superfamily)